MKSQVLFDVPISLGRYDSFLNKIFDLTKSGKGSYVCLLNVHMMIEAQRKKDFKTIIKEADIVTPDGKPITWALQLLANIKQDRVAGMDIFPDLLSQLEKQNKSIFFYGGTEEMLQKTKAYVLEKFPKLNVSGYHAPPFRKLTQLEEDLNIKVINGSGAKIVFVVLGCPKQEIWMASMKNKINAVMIGIGGALPVVIGSRKRAPLWMQKNGLEWFFRLIQEPRRLLRRYTVTNAWFLYLLTRGYFSKFLKVRKIK